MAIDVLATLVVDFQKATSTTTPGLTLEIDSRPDGLNMGNTSFRRRSPFNDQVGILRFASSAFKTPPKGSLDRGATSGSLNPDRSGDIAYVENFTLSRTASITLPRPAKGSGSISVSFIGQRFDANGNVKAIGYTVADDQTINFDEPVIGIAQVSYTAFGEGFMLQGSNEDQVLVWSIGKVDD